MMLSVLKSTALHDIKWHFLALTFDARHNSRDHFGISWQKRPFPLDSAVNFFTRDPDRNKMDVLPDHVVLLLKIV